jgi:hypothetical protein
MRYGRAGWGMAASQAYPSCSGDAATCRLDGFITSNAWGAGAAGKPLCHPWPDLTLTPALTLGQDVRGYSYDGQFSRGALPPC